MAHRSMAIVQQPSPTHPPATPTGRKPVLRDTRDHLQTRFTEAGVGAVAFLKCWRNALYVRYVEQLKRVHQGQFITTWSETDFEKQPVTLTKAEHLAPDTIPDNLAETRVRIFDGALKLITITLYYRQRRSTGGTLLIQGKQKHGWVREEYMALCRYVQQLRAGAASPEHNIPAAIDSAPSPVTPPGPTNGCLLDVSLDHTPVTPTRPITSSVADSPGIALLTQLPIYNDQPALHCDINATTPLPRPSLVDAAEGTAAIVRGDVTALSGGTGTSTSPGLHRTPSSPGRLAQPTPSPSRNDDQDLSPANSEATSSIQPLTPNFHPLCPTAVDTSDSVLEPHSGLSLLSNVTPTVPSNTDSDIAASQPSLHQPVTVDINLQLASAHELIATLRTEMASLKSDLTCALARIDQLDSAIKDNAVKVTNDLKVSNSSLSELDDTVSTLTAQVTQLSSTAGNQRQVIQDVRKRVKKLTPRPPTPSLAITSGDVTPPRAASEPSASVSGDVGQASGARIPVRISADHAPQEFKAGLDSAINLPRSHHIDRLPPDQLIFQQTLQADTTTLVLGDSTVKHLKGNKMATYEGDTVQVVSVSGLTSTHLTHWLKTLPVFPHISCVTLHVGINDCKSSEVTSQMWENLIHDCKRVFPEARFMQASSILPARRGPRHAMNIAIGQSNANLCHVCRKFGATFLDNTPSFTTTKGLPRKALYSDTIHPSGQGIARLAYSIKWGGHTADDDHSQTAVKEAHSQTEIIQTSSSVVKRQPQTHSQSHSEPSYSAASTDRVLSQSIEVDQQNILPNHQQQQQHEQFIPQPQWYPTPWLQQIANPYSLYNLPPVRQYPWAPSHGFQYSALSMYPSFSQTLQPV